MSDILDSVYILWHSHSIDDSEEDDKIIGVYVSEEDAELARQRTMLLPGFCDFPDSFEICKHILGEDGWKEGFSTTNL